MSQTKSQLIGNVSGGASFTGIVTATSYAVSGTTIIDNSGNLTNIANASVLACPNTYVLRGADGKICADSVSVPLVNGGCFEGGNLMCKSSGVYWIVAPNTSEVSRTWYLRDDANTIAQSVSGCTGWFVPTTSQLQNPGYSARFFWDSFSSTFYWSSTEVNATHACLVGFTNGTASGSLKTATYCVRAFRCVTY